MGTILFECPITGRPVSTGIETRLVLKPSPSAFADFRKRGSTYIARSVGASMGRKSGLPRKRRLQ
jgi:hypothetical protein